MSLLTSLVLVTVFVGSALDVAILHGSRRAAAVITAIEFELVPLAFLITYLRR